MIDTIYIPVMNLGELVEQFKSGVEDKEYSDLLKYGQEKQDKLNGLLNHGGKVIFSSVMTVGVRDYYVFKVHTPDQGEEDA